jgi:dGTPase
VVDATVRTGQVGMDEDAAEALAAFRACNYERIYLRDASVRQGEAVVSVLRALVEHFSDRPHLIAEPGGDQLNDLGAGSAEAIRAAVTYVAGMTDRFAFRQAVALLGWDQDKLPVGVGA